jgi:hypothetical protein
MGQHAALCSLGDDCVNVIRGMLAASIPCHPNKPAVPMRRFRTPEEALAVAREPGGVAVLALALQNVKLVHGNGSAEDARSSITRHLTPCTRQMRITTNHLVPDRCKVLSSRDGDRLFSIAFPFLNLPQKYFLCQFSSVKSSLSIGR